MWGDQTSAFSTYARLCLEQTQAEFCRAHPFPVLLFSNVQATGLKPVKKTKTPTIDRLVVGETPEGGVPSVTSEEWYIVYELIPRQRTSERVSLGCSSRCDVRLDDVSVSRFHAWVNSAPHGYYLEDADSSAGTAHNGETLEPGKTVRLKAGDRISLGNVDLVFLPPADFHTFVLRLKGLLDR
jgi:hypothetical protein